MAIAALDSWVTQSSTQDISSYPVSAGTDRALFVFVACEDNSSTNVTSMTYGGQTMILASDGTTSAKESNTGGGSDTYGELWYCLESEISAASGSTINVTMDNGSISQYMIAAGSYEGVDQSGNGAGNTFEDITTAQSTASASTTATINGLFLAVHVDRVDRTPLSVSNGSLVFELDSAASASIGGSERLNVSSGNYSVTFVGGGSNRPVAIGLGVNPGADTTDDLLADDDESSSETSSPVITQEHSISSSDTQSTSSISSPVVGQLHGLGSVSVETTSEITSPAIELVSILTATSISSNSNISSPVIAQVHAVVAPSLESQSSGSTSSLAQIQILTSDSLDSASEVSVPTAVESNILTTTSIESPSGVGTLIDGVSARALLETKGWTITDGGLAA